MCGIAGFVDFSRKGDLAGYPVWISRMTATLSHRGPDDEGAWVDREAGIGLGHRRLSILDLSSAGHQPMHSHCGRYVIIFNGEIYNYRELRCELDAAGAGLSWQGHSDTEVLLAAISVWGIERALEKINGMFAFALWNKQERMLYLARDRMGEKPLFFGMADGYFLFGSELKALRSHPAWQGIVNRDALALYLRHNYVPSPHSIYQGVYKLLPGCFLALPVGEAAQGPAKWEIEAYWSLQAVAEDGVRHPFEGSEEELLGGLQKLLANAVGLRMASDVPLGAFLSGGIDSTLVVALMQQQSRRPVKTYTIGFHEQAYNEAEFAKNVANHLGTEHTELYLSADDVMAVIPKLPDLYDEPFSDSSQLPTFLVSELASRDVTVSLSGDGGDELFGGYNRYFWGNNIWQKLGWLPSGIRKCLATGICSVRPQAWDRLFSVVSNPFPKCVPKHPGHKMHVLAEVLSAANPEVLYRDLVSHWKDPALVVVGGGEVETALTDPGRAAKLENFMQRMMYLDAISYLPDDILVKVDRASMGSSLEVRVPMLDHRVVEYAWRLPLSMKVRRGQGKWALTQLLSRFVQREMVDRPKMGFGVPLDVWLRGPLREWAEALLDEGRLKRDGFFHHGPIRQKWLEHLSGKRNWQYYLWDLLMFQTWMEAQ